MTYACKILADSISPSGIRLTSVEGTYPRFILAEANTHRMISKSSASSRAIPIEKMIQRVTDNPFVPTYWGKNQKGMQAEEELGPVVSIVAADTWLKARDQAVLQVMDLIKLGVHKQLANRLLEPFLWQTSIWSGTDWSNFFGLRDHKDAQPEFRDIAALMQEEFKKSDPKLVDYGEWHLPLVRAEELNENMIAEGREGSTPQIDWPFWVKVCVGRCCRVSYLTHDGKRDLQADVDLAEKIKSSGHMCYDEVTEVLTERGWVAWPNVTDHDRLYSVDISSGLGGFERPSALHRYAVQENLYHVHGQRLDLMVTTNHRMAVSSRMHGGGWSKFKFVPAKELVDGKPVRYLVSSDSTEDTHAKVPDAASTRTGFFKFLGFFIGDGHSRSTNSAEFHLKKSRKVEYLKSLGVHVKDMANDKYVVSQPGLGEWLRNECYRGKHKHIPEFMLTACTADVLSLLDGLRNSDGSEKRSSWTYSTESLQVADMLQALLHTHGMSGSVRVQYEVEGKKYYTVNVSRRISPRVEMRQHDKSDTYAHAIVPYEGAVYCATVSTGALMVRRDGKVAVSGNSPWEHAARPMTLDEIKKYNKGTRLAAVPYLGNFRGWVQARKEIPYEHDFSLISKELAVNNVWLDKCRYCPVIVPVGPGEVPICYECWQKHVPAWQKKIVEAYDHVVRLIRTTFF